MQTKDFENYMIEARKTMNTYSSYKEQTRNCAMGLVGEVGELVDMYKKHFYQGHELDISGVEEELGDVFWYLFNYAYLMLSRARVESFYEWLAEKTMEERRIDNKDSKENIFNIIHSLSVVFSGNESDTMYNLIELYTELVKLAEIERLTVSKILRANIKKLQKRYSNGRFESEKSINREV